MDKQQTLSIPHDVEAEQAVLGAILEDNELIDSVLEKISPNCFYKSSHQHIFRAMVEMVDNEIPIDEVTLGDQLKKLNQLNEAGGYAYLAELLECVPSSGNIVYYAAIIDEHATLRDLIQTTVDIGRKSRDPEQNVTDLLTNAEESIAEIAGKQGRTDPVLIRDALRKAFLKLEKISESKKDTIGIPTGYIDLDRFTLGLIPKDLIYIAARPSMGKTALALNIASYITTRTEEKGAQLIISLEMSDEQLGIRMLSSEARIDSKKIRIGDLESTEWDKMAMATDKLSVGNMHIDESARTIPEIRAKARKLARSEDGLALIIVDYLQLMDGPKDIAKGSESEIAYLSKHLKRIAKDFNIPVIALSQLNRSLESRPDKHPKLSDLRGSGSIEQDGDIIIFIYRDEVYDEDSPDKGIAEFIVSKNRNGPTGTVRVAFVAKYTKFANLSRQEP